MNFPMQYPLFQFLYWFVNTPGIGGIVVGLVAGGSILAYSLTLRGIARGQSAETETYSYPTHRLLHPEEHMTPDQ